MNKSKATVLIEQHRRRWRSQASDEVIVRRAERTYLALAILHIGLVGVFAALFPAAGFLPRAVPVAFLIAGVAYFWESRRFTQIRRCLSETDAKID
jgi:CHASE2 domain-containing sensor protein